MIESQVNEKIRDDVLVSAQTMSFDEAVDRGALAFFGEKYGEEVRMVDAGGFSMELCGGTHVGRTGQIGLFRILSAASVSAGVRRIEALTGERSLEYDNQKLRELKEVSELLKTPLDKVSDKVHAVIDENKSLRRDLSEAEERIIGTVVDELLLNAELIGDTKFIPRNLGHERMDYLRRVSDVVKEKCTHTVAVLGALDGKRALLICIVTDDLTNRLDASHIIRKVSAIVGGGGGGRRDFAQAGGSRPERLDEALSQARDVISEALAKTSGEQG